MPAKKESSPPRTVEDSAENDRSFVLEKTEARIWLRRDAFRRRTFYRALCEALDRGDGSLFLSQEQFEVAEREFIRSEAWERWPQIPLLPTPKQLPVGVKEALRPLMSRIYYWQCKAALAKDETQYDRAKEELQRLVMELKRIAATLVPPKPRFSKIKRDLYGALLLFTRRLFFWVLMHEEFKALRQKRKDTSTALRKLKQHYSSYLPLPSDFDSRVLSPPRDNAQQDVAEEFGLHPDSVPVLLSRLRSRPR